MFGIKVVYKGIATRSIRATVHNYFVWRKFEKATSNTVTFPWDTV